MSEIAGGLSARQIRGSGLLFVGRLIGRGLEFSVQVLLIRYLAQAEYGAVAYVLSIVLLGQTLVALGLPETIARFVPLYRDRQQYDRLVGTVVLAAGVIVGLGVAVVLALMGFAPLIGQALIKDETTLTLLLILAFLIPIEALNNLLTNLFASFVKPKAIFLRRSVIMPGLKLLAALATIAVGGDTIFLAGALLAGGIVGLVLYLGLFVQLLAEEDLLCRFQDSPVRPPVRELATFALSMVSSTTIWLLLQSSSTLLLGYFRGSAEVALFAVVMPIVGLNQMVSSSFAILYTPLATRLHASGDQAGLSRLYWQTAIWMAILCFPAFAVTLAFARPVLVTLYGPTYEASAAVLAVLAVGYFFQTATGFNGLTLRIYRRLRYSVAVDVVAVLVNLALTLLLVPQWGALGAALATTGTLLVHNLVKQVGLRMASGIGLGRGPHLRAYVGMGLAAPALALLAVYLPDSVAVVTVATLIASALVVALGWQALDLRRIFPELSRLPIARAIFARSEVEVS